MKLIVGLGNSGAKFAGTRHNIGFAVVDRLALRYGTDWKSKAAWNGEVATLNEDVLLLKPQTFMNDSGRAVRAVAQFYKLDPADVSVVYDDRDLPFGDLRWLTGIRTGAHHNGMRSIVADYSRYVERLRVGIANDLMPQRPLDEFVLSAFSGEEKKDLDGIIERACDELVQRLGVKPAN